MDTQKIAIDLATFLAPFLPHLILARDAAIKEIGKSTVDVAKSLWDLIKEKIQKDKKLENISLALAEDPDDEDLLTIFAKSLTEFLVESPELLAKFSDLVNNEPSIQTILVSGGSKVENITQNLKQKGKQEVRIRDSQAGNITQKQ